MGNLWLHGYVAKSTVLLSFFMHESGALYVPQASALCREWCQISIRRALISCHCLGVVYTVSLALDVPGRQEQSKRSPHSLQPVWAFQDVLEGQMPGRRA